MRVHYILILIVLVLFWLLLSGHYVALILAFGVISALLVTYFLVRMDKVDEEPVVFRAGFAVLHYFGWLMWQVVLSNIEVARCIWNPRLPIRPQWQRLDVKVSTPMEITLYANSITLTPGTLTTNVKKDHFMIHSLDPDGIEELRKGEMEARIRHIGV